MSPAGFVSVYAAGNEEVTIVRAIGRGLYISGYVNGELIGLASTELVDVEVTITPSGREVIEVRGIDPSSAPIPIEVRVNRN